MTRSFVTVCPSVATENFISKADIRILQLCCTIEKVTCTVLTIRHSITAACMQFAYRLKTGLYIKYGRNENELL